MTRSYYGRPVVKEPVWQPERPIAVRSAKAGKAAARFETKKDSFEVRNCLDVVIAIIGFRFPHALYQAVLI